MRKTKIEWCDYTWNPVTGCHHGCDYCYARRISRRFCTNEHGKQGLMSPCAGDCNACSIMDGYEFLGEKIRYNHGKAPYPYGFMPTFHSHRLDEPAKLKNPSSIFVCSMGDLFGEWVPDKWIKEVLTACATTPWHSYLFLTKNPDRYYQLDDRDSNILPDVTVPDEEFGGWYLGASASAEEEAQKAYENMCISWMSLEPLHGNFSEEFFFYQDSISDTEPRWNWLVVGTETGNRKNKIIPKEEWIEDIIDNCKLYDIPLFMKDSLIPIIGEENMKREFPVGMKRRK